MRFAHRILIFLLLVFANCALAQQAPPLTVVVVIDQFGMDLIHRYGDLFGNDGFKRLEREGALFAKCRYSHAVLETGPGHATIATGCNPWKHGIVANGWKTTDGKDVYCVECADEHPVGAQGITDTVSSYCPDNLSCDGLSDAWRAKFGEAAKVWSLSLKDRAAVTMGGRQPNGALWFDRASGGFETSTYYSDSLPAWCVKYNTRTGEYFAQTWERAVRPEGYFRCETDDAWFEDGAKAGLSNTLPKVVTGGEDSPGKGYVRAVQATPFGNDLLLGLAKECISGEKLGKDKTPDLLWVSFSSNDICGHLFGPWSQEICDFTVRTDKVIAALLAHLDLKFGRGDYWFALTADHGVCPACESALLPSGMGGRFAFDKLETELEDHLAQKFLGGAAPRGGLVTELGVPNVSLDLKAIDAKGLVARDVAEACASWLRAQRGVSHAVVTMTDADVQAISDAKLRSHVERSFNAERFSQLYLHPQPYWQSDGICANHGSIHDYDTHVPLYLLGKPFGKGENTAAADPTDLAATLGAAAGLSWQQARDGTVRMVAGK